MRQIHRKKTLQTSRLSKIGFVLAALGGLGALMSGTTSVLPFFGIEPASASAVEAPLTESGNASEAQPLPPEQSLSAASEMASQPSDTASLTAHEEQVADPVTTAPPERDFLYTQPGTKTVSFDALPTTVTPCTGGASVRLENDVRGARFLVDGVKLEPGERRDLSETCALTAYALDNPRSYQTSGALTVEFRERK